MVTSFQNMMVEKEGKFWVGLLQILPIISSRTLYFALFSRFVQSAFYPDSLQPILFLQRYLNCWRRENLHVNLLRNEFCFLPLQQIFNDLPTSLQNSTLIFFEVQIAVVFHAEQSEDERDFLCALLCLWHTKPASFLTWLQPIKNNDFMLLNLPLFFRVLSTTCFKVSEFVNWFLHQAKCNVSLWLSFMLMLKRPFSLSMSLSPDFVIHFQAVYVEFPACLCWVIFL